MSSKLTSFALAATATLATAGLGSAALAGSASAATAHPSRVVGHVYQNANDAVGNAVHVYDRYADGRLEAAGSVATGGLDRAIGPANVQISTKGSRR